MAHWRGNETVELQQTDTDYVARDRETGTAAAGRTAAEARRNLQTALARRRERDGRVAADIYLSGRGALLDGGTR